MKKLIILVLGSIISNFCMGTTVVGKFKYILNNNDMTFTFGLDASYEGELDSIPLTFYYNKKNYTYAGLSEGAFRSCSKLTKVVIPKGTKVIPDYAFYCCSKLKTVIMPSEVEEIGTEAFYCCFVLDNLVIPENVSSIGNRGIYRTNALDHLIYLPLEEPDGWQVNTYNYIRPGANYDKRDAAYTQAVKGSLVNMITWGNNDHDYDGQVHPLNYTCNIPNFRATIAEPNTRKDAGKYQEDLLVTFTNDTISFTTTIRCSYTISKAQLKATADNKEILYGDEPSYSITLNGLTSESDRKDVMDSITIDCKANAASNVGVYPINLSGGHKNYTIEFCSGNLTINKAPLKVYVNDCSKIYGKSNPIFTCRFDGLKNNELVPDWSVEPTFLTDVDTKTSVGKYNVNINCEAKNYEVKAYNGTITITAAPLVIKANDASRLYSENEPQFGFVCSGFVNDENQSVLTKSPSFSTNAELKSKAGEYTITPYGAEATNYIITYETGILIVNKRTLTAIADDKKRAYGDINPDFTIKYEGFVNQEDESALSKSPLATCTANTFSNIGDYCIQVSGGQADNYNINYQNGILTVCKAELKATVISTTKTYGQENPTFDLSYEGLKNNETAPTWEIKPTYTTQANKQSGIGEYVVSVSCDAKNYAIELNSGVLTITPADLIITANDTSRVYFENLSSYNYSCDGFVNDDTKDVFLIKPEFKTDANVVSNVGCYKIIPYGANAKNYNISYRTGTLTITKRKISAKVNTVYRSYGEDNPAFTIHYEGFVNNESESVISEKPEIVCNATQYSEVGEYPIFLSGGLATNYDIQLENGILIIQKSPLSVYVNDTTKVYGASNPTFTCRYEGLKNNEHTPSWITSPTFSTLATETSGIGVYPVHINACNAKNYDITCYDGNLTVTKASLVLRPSNKTRLYYEENPQFTYVCDGFLNEDNYSIFTKEPTFECSATKTSKAGKYTIKISNAECKNYQLEYKDGTLTINKRILEVKPIDIARKYLEDNPVFEYTVSGFVNNESVNVLTHKPVLSAPADKYSDVGNYPIVASGAEAENYSFAYTDGILTVNKADQQIFWEQDFDGINVGDQIELLATSSSELEIEYTFDTNYASLYCVGSQKYLDCLSAGTFTIRAMQSGNKNFNAAVRVAKNITISDPTGISSVIAESYKETLYFDLSGHRILCPQKESLVIELKNGKAKKIRMK